MNLKAKWAIFTLVGTLVNLLLMVSLFLLLTTISKMILGNEADPVTVRTFFFVVLILSLFGSFGLYGLILRWVNKKWDLEEKLGRSLWGKRKKR